MLADDCEAREICLHLADFNATAYNFQDFVDSLTRTVETARQTRQLEFEKVLRYADFPELNCRLPSSWDELRKDYQEVHQVLMWLKNSKNVSEVMEIKVLDRLWNPHHHELIAECVQKLKISSLNWRRLDLYLNGLDPHKSLRTLHLYTGGNPAVLNHWFGEKLMKRAKARAKDLQQQNEKNGRQELGEQRNNQNKVGNQQTGGLENRAQMNGEQEPPSEEVDQKTGVANGITANKGGTLKGETEESDERGLWDLKVSRLMLKSQGK